ncbi:uncharacterized protein V1518DRAFT_305569 [Limtongia smithiae]|uniref:uncharacterized protein n=1 Tax=Limtongia smithiae TaxID=1125753 RepID=UPI0034CF0637
MSSAEPMRLALTHFPQPLCETLELQTPTRLDSLNAQIEPLVASCLTCAHRNQGPNQNKSRPNPNVPDMLKISTIESLTLSCLSSAHSAINSCAAFVCCFGYWSAAWCNYCYTTQMMFGSLMKRQRNAAVRVEPEISETASTDYASTQGRKEKKTTLFGRRTPGHRSSSKFLHASSPLSSENLPITATTKAIQEVPLFDTTCSGKKRRDFAATIRASCARITAHKFKFSDKRTKIPSKNGSSKAPLSNLFATADPVDKTVVMRIPDMRFGLSEAPDTETYVRIPTKYTGDVLEINEIPGEDEWDAFVNSVTNASIGDISIPNTPVADARAVTITAAAVSVNNAATKILVADTIDLDTSAMDTSAALDVSSVDSSVAETSDVDIEVVDTSGVDTSNIDTSGADSSAGNGAVVDISILDARVDTGSIDSFNGLSPALNISANDSTAPVSASDVKISAIEVGVVNASVPDAPASFSVVEIPIIDMSVNETATPRNVSSMYTLPSAPLRSPDKFSDNRRPLSLITDVELRREISRTEISFGEFISTPFLLSTSPAVDTCASSNTNTSVEDDDGMNHDYGDGLLGAFMCSPLISTPDTIHTTPLETQDEGMLDMPVVFPKAVNDSNSHEDTTDAVAEYNPLLQSSITIEYSEGQQSTTLNSPCSAISVLMTACCDVMFKAIGYISGAREYAAYVNNQQCTLL